MANYAAIQSVIGISCYEKELFKVCNTKKDYFGNV